MGILHLQYPRDIGPGPEDLEVALHQVFSSSTCSIDVRVNDDRNEIDGKPEQNFGRIEARIQDMTVSEWYLYMQITTHPLLKNIVGAEATDDE